MRKVCVFLVVSGVSAVTVALLWWRLSVPSGDELRSARSDQAANDLTSRILGSEAPAFSMPGAATTGPIIVAIVGAFVILCGVILVAGHRDD